MNTQQTFYSEPGMGGRDNTEKEMEALERFCAQATLPELKTAAASTEAGTFQDVSSLNSISRDIVDAHLLLAVLSRELDGLKSRGVALKSATAHGVPLQERLDQMRELLGRQHGYETGALDPSLVRDDHSQLAHKSARRWGA